MSNVLGLYLELSTLKIFGQFPLIPRLLNTATTILIMGEIISSNVITWERATRIVGECFGIPNRYMRIGTNNSRGRDESAG